MASSEDAQLLVIRTRLLTFVPMVGATLAVRLGTLASSGSDGKLYLMEAPENVTFPYAVMKPYGTGLSREDGKFSGQKQIEIQIYHTPRDMEATIRAMGDVIEQAWRHWVDGGNGVVFATGKPERQTIKFEPPADREMIAERLVLSYVSYPLYLTQYSA